MTRNRRGAPTGSRHCRDLVGLMSPVRMSSGKFWASWADALHMVAQRLPAVADQILRTLNADVQVVVWVTCRNLRTRWTAMVSLIDLHGDS